MEDDFAGFERAATTYMTVKHFTKQRSKLLWLVVGGTTFIRGKVLGHLYVSNYEGMPDQ